MTTSKSMDYNLPTILIGTSYINGNIYWGLINHAQQWVVSPSYEFIQKTIINNLLFFKLETFEGKLGLADQNGYVVIPPIYDTLSHSDMHGNFIHLTNAESHFYCDLYGNIIVQAFCKSISLFDDAGSTFIIEIFGEKFGAIDRAGNWVIPPIYDKLFAWEMDGVAYYKHAFDFGIISNEGNIIISGCSDILYIKNSRKLLSIKLRDKWYLVDSAGQKAIPEGFDVPMTSLFDNFYFTYESSLLTIYNENLEALLPYYCSDLEVLPELMVFAGLDMWCFFNKEGRFQHIQVKNIQLYVNCEKYFIITNTSDKQGAIDVDGKIVIMPIYTELECIKDKIFLASDEVRTYILDDKGMVLFAKENCTISSYYGDLFILSTAFDFSYIDCFGQAVYPLKFFRGNELENYFDTGYFFPDISPDDYQSFIEDFKITSPYQILYFYKSSNIFTPFYGFAIVLLGGKKTLLINIAGFNSKIIGFETHQKDGILMRGFLNPDNSLVYVDNEGMHIEELPRKAEYRNLANYINSFLNQE